MYNRPEQVLEQYELEVKSVSKGREGYICDTSQGKKVLKEYRGSAERAEFMYEILTFLRENELLVETVNRTKEGSPCGGRGGTEIYSARYIFRRRM